ncbi:ammonium transporter [Vibrio europaeus]|uniref:ammonium transporter n=1 Tax=Vibrio europaeus TaxID=300876 RepID=UPI0039E0B3C0
MDPLFILLCTLLVLLMQVGFLFLEAGTVRKKNTANVAAKNLIDLAVVLILYWLVGYGVMFGESMGGYLGTSHFLLGHFEGLDDGAFFVFQMVFCATSVTIISGAIAERGSLKGYIALSVFVAVVVYPVIGHWVWSDNGWLAQRGFVDFAGSTVVHSVGGWAALAAIMIIGPRLNRFVEGHNFNHSSLVQSVAGVVFLWIGWLGFNAGSSLHFDSNVFNIVLNTILAGAAGGLTSAMYSLHKTNRVHIPNFYNGILSGLVSITASCNFVDGLSSVLIGALGALISLAVGRLLVMKKIDDVVDAVPVHLASGIWGTIALALFVPQSVITDTLLMGDRLELLWSQVFGVSVVAAFVFPLCYLVFFLINKVLPLRVGQEEEIVGLNISSHQASSDLYDLVTVMQNQEESGDFSQRVDYDPTSEIGMIARQYNRVLSRFETALVKATQKHSALLQTNQRLKSMESRVQKSEKLSSIGQISSGLVREINEPIGYVLSNIKTLKDYNKFFKLLVTEYKAFAATVSQHPVVANEVLQRIDKICEEEDLEFVLEDSEELINATSDGASKIEKILSNVRTFSEFGDEKFELKDINVLVSAAVEKVAATLSLSCKLLESYEAKLPMVSCSPHQIEQLCINVLSNSVQAIGEDRGAIKVTTSNEGNHVVVAIIDSGVGIKEEYQSKVFEPFFTTFGNQGHAGLGLSICYGIATNHGGSLSLLSKQAKGTKVTLRLPMPLDE